MLDKINNFMRHNPKYNALSKPLTAAKVCDAARSLTQYHLTVISFKDGLLTIGSSSPAEANNLQMQSTQIIKEINEKLNHEKAPVEQGQGLVTRLRYKIV